MAASSDRENRIAFRALAESDLPTVLRWLSDPGVAEWWRESDLSLESLIGKYQPIIDGNEPTRCFVIVIDGRDVGMIQCYFVADHPDYARQIGLPRGSVGTDLFFGDSELRGKGWASPMLAAFHRRIVFGEMGAKLAVIAPEPANLRAIHVYERVGFRWLKTVPIKNDDPLQSGKEFVMVMTPEEFGGMGKSAR